MHAKVLMSFEQFLSHFIPKVKQKSKQVNQASWILETTGSHDAALLKAALETELRLLFHDRATFDQLLAWDQDASIQDPLLKRQLHILIRTFKPNLIPSKLLEDITQQEAMLAYLYSNFRPILNGKAYTENGLRNILKQELDVEIRKQAWNASKEIGKALSSHILKLVQLRNEAAKSLGYDNYFSMQLELQEVDEQGLFDTLDQLAIASDSAYLKVVDDIQTWASKKFHVSKDEVGPWAWSEPFCQEDPVDSQSLDALVKDVDILKAAQTFYSFLGFDVEEILKRSDNFERPGKNQHAFCTHIDREGDIRTLNNVQHSIKWMETVLHELGHAVYEKGYPSDLPWLLKEPPHMITTEAMALLAGRQAYRKSFLNVLCSSDQEPLIQQAEKSLIRRQLIFSRWVLVMTYFERELYRNPNQNLNELWWKLVEKFQKITCQGSPFGCDWAAKYHIGLAPAYYFSYLLGELFASMIETQLPLFASKETGAFLNEKMFKLGNRLSWDKLIQHTMGEELNAKAWLQQFAFIS